MEPQRLCLFLNVYTPRQRPKLKQRVVKGVLICVLTLIWTKLPPLGQRFTNIDWPWTTFPTKARRLKWISLRWSVIKKFLPQIERCLSYLVKNKAWQRLCCEQKDAMSLLFHRKYFPDRRLLFKKSPSKTNLVPLLDRWLIKIQGEYIFY